MEIMKYQKIIFTIIIISITYLLIYNFPLINSSNIKINKINTEKIIINSIEKINLIGPKGNKKVWALIDTGADKSSIDTNLAQSLGFENKLNKVIVRNVHGDTTRWIISVKFELKGKIIKGKFTLVDRSKMRYLVLIGKEDLKGFLVNP